MEKQLSALDISKSIISKIVKEGDLCIDATAGRGYDTVFLCGLVGESGRVLSFDIQQSALDSTAQLLANNGLSDRAELIFGSHANMDKYAEKKSVSCITFNFGWLPGGDHNIHTVKSSSLEAVEKALSLIKHGGLISMIIYYGRENGFDERDALLEYVRSIDNSEFTVITADFSNRRNCYPIPVFIYRD